MTTSEIRKTATPQQRRSQRWRKVRAMMSAIAPAGPAEFVLGFQALDRLLAPAAIARVYIVGFLLAPVIVALILIAGMSTGFSDAPGLMRALLGAVIGYNALAVVSALTAALLLAVAALVMLGYIRVLRVRLDLRAAAARVGAWIGGMSAVGALSAALTPIVAVTIPSSAALTPAILVDVPAGFAVVGYALGMVHAMVDVCREASNLIVRRLLAPGMLVAGVFAVVGVGLGPARILRSILGASSPQASAQPLEGCDERSLDRHLDDPAWLMRAIEACGGQGTALDDRTFGWVAAAVVVIWAITAFVRDVRRRMSARRTP